MFKLICRSVIIAMIAVFTFSLGKKVLAEVKSHPNHLYSDKSSVNFIWEGLERDIPEQGEYIQISAVRGNTVFLNPIDE